ncbi:MAG: glycosyl hydrolase [Bacteroidetes bacterium]|jgi:photosystem II stability/assembly factor-like uncharacterized protein|nr:glycosyl hydrolase [Bacteroidota bacterium]MDF1865731.1 glycosyl hydrolase [Saprospiraceae bacterium]
MNKNLLVILAFLTFFSIEIFAQKKKKNPIKTSVSTFKADDFKSLKFRNIGPFRGGRSNAVSGVNGDNLTYYFGSVGGGIWKTEDAGVSWRNITDGFLKSGSVGAIAVSKADPNIIYAGMGEHAVRGVMTSHGDGVYKSMDAGKTWVHMGLKDSRHIAAIRINPTDPNIVYVAVQGALWGSNKDRGVYKSADGGKTWRNVLFVDEKTGAVDLSMDASNPRVLYAGMWDYQRHPWKVRSGGEGSGIWKSMDGGESWKQLKKGLPKMMGKVSVDVSPANPNRVYANIEAEKGGVFRSDNGGESWTQVNSDRITVARAWYYIETFADPVDENTVYVLNAPVLKSIDGGKSFTPVSNPHSDQHDLWINPDNPQNMILGNDGGGCVTFNGGKTWSTQQNQPTAQFYRVITDNRFPYHIYAGQQDNSTVAIASRTRSGGIGMRDWYPVAGGESAFLAFDPDNPELIYGNSIQGFTDVYDHTTGEIKDIMAYPQLNLGTLPRDMKYRFNWNNPLISSPQNPKVLYHGAQLVLKSDNGGISWTEISPDLTRNDPTKHDEGGVPFTNEAAGGEVYNTLSYLAASPHAAGVIWAGSDDGLVHVTQDEGKNWKNVTPTGLSESLINAIEVSPHDPATAYLAVTRYKFNDLSPMIYVTNDFGTTWKMKINGIPGDNFTRVVREDPVKKGVLYAGTEDGLYISFNGGDNWTRFQSNLPVCPITDLIITDNDLVVATSGRAFWILDDLSAIQQSMGKSDMAKAKIFRPKPTYKFTLNASKKAPPNEGQNPANGVIFDYYLPKNWTDTSELSLVISDVFQNTLRTYSNQKPEKFKTWPGGPPKPEVLPSKAGMNRFNWDLRRQTLPSIDGIFVMGDYRGHTVPPGDYLFKLMTETDTSVTMVKVVPDPRLKSDLGEHGNQQVLLLQIEEGVKDIHHSVNQLRSVKNQLSERLELLKEMGGKELLIKKGEMVMEAMTKWEENLIQPKQKTFQDVINFKNQLNAQLLALKGQIDSHEPKPTKGAIQRLKDLSNEWAIQKAEMERIINEEVNGFNKAYAKAKLPVLIMPK